MELYMVELPVADLPAALAWYRDVLRLPVLLEKPAEGFALLAAGSGRVALKQHSKTNRGELEASSPMLVFEVADLEAELARLAEVGVAGQCDVKESAEGYRRAILCDPDGNRLCLFAWTMHRTVG